MSPPMIPHHAAMPVITQLLVSVHKNAPAIISGISSGSGSPKPQANSSINTTITPPVNPRVVIQCWTVVKLKASRNGIIGRGKGTVDGGGCQCQVIGD